jgi:hypothetical protein
MRYKKSATDRSKNFEERLAETTQSELEPEFVSPVTAGAEELDYDFPLIDQFKQTNMRPNNRGVRGQSRLGGKQDE